MPFTIFMFYVRTQTSRYTKQRPYKLVDFRVSRPTLQLRSYGADPNLCHQSFVTGKWKRGSRVVSALASCARGPGFDPRRAEENLLVRTRFPSCHLQV